jgi:hypothetical protein
MSAPTITISERHEDGSIQIHDSCDARAASVILETAWEIMWPPYEIVADFVKANDQGENLLGDDESIRRQIGYVIEPDLDDIEPPQYDGDLD